MADDAPYEEFGDSTCRELGYRIHTATSAPQEADSEGNEISQQRELHESNIIAAKYFVGRLHQYRKDDTGIHGQNSLASVVARRRIGPHILAGLHRCCRLLFFTFDLLKFLLLKNKKRKRLLLAKLFIHK